MIGGATTTPTHDESECLWRWPDPPARFADGLRHRPEQTARYRPKRVMSASRAEKSATREFLHNMSDTADATRQLQNAPA